MLKEIALSLLLETAPVPDDPQDAGAFKLTTLNPDKEITCQIGADCLYESEVVAENITGGPLHNTTIYTGIYSERIARLMGFEILGFDGEWTWGKSKTDQVIEPGDKFITKIRFQAGQAEGRYVRTVYVDGAVRNEATGEEIYYGGSSLSVAVNRVP